MTSETFQTKLLVDLEAEVKDGSPQNEAGNLGVESNFHLAMVLFELEEYDKAS